MIFISSSQSLTGSAFGPAFSSDEICLFQDEIARWKSMIDIQYLYRN